MRALLLSAGLGTRLRPITDNIPKCLVPIHGRPLMDYWLELLTTNGISPVLVNLHFFPDQVTTYLKTSRFSAQVQTVFEKQLLGTGGTLLQNRDFFSQEPFFLIHGDNLSAFSVQDFVHAHVNRPKGCEMTMMLFHSPTPETCGIVELDEKGVVMKFHEKVKNPPGNLANGAVYILEPTVFDFLVGLKKDFIDFSTDVIPHFLGRISTFTNAVFHCDIGTPETLEWALNRFPPKSPALR